MRCGGVPGPYIVGSHWAAKETPPGSPVFRSMPGHGREPPSCGACGRRLGMLREVFDRRLLQQNLPKADYFFHFARSFARSSSRITSELVNPLSIKLSSNASRSHLGSRLGIIFLTCSTTRAGQKRQSIVCAVRCAPRQTTPTRCSISRCCFSETTSTPRRPTIGGVISLMTINLNGQHGRVGP
jgi:hypothetical protein